MTQDEVLKNSQKTIIEESKKISESVTRILLLAGPQAAQLILRSFIEANERIMKELKIDFDIKFEEGAK